jgi:hypothetical protein
VTCIVESPSSLEFYSLFLYSYRSYRPLTFHQSSCAVVFLLTRCFKDPKIHQFFTFPFSIPVSVSPRRQTACSPSSPAGSYAGLVFPCLELSLGGSGKRKALSELFYFYDSTSSDSFTESIICLRDSPVVAVCFDLQKRARLAHLGNSPRQLQNTAISAFWYIPPAVPL